MDLCDAASAADALDEIRRRYGTITSIIHAAGVPTAPSLTKTTKEMLRVLNPKVTGVLNILDYLSRNNLSLDNLVMASSLSSIITLQGTEDYSASNLFMDALAMKGHKNVKRMLAIQWPSWKDAGMASTYKNEALKSIISKASISTRIGKRIIRETLGMSGVVAYSPVPPPQMARMVEEIQLKGSARQMPTVREHFSLTDK
ncbi:KR domain protein, partial [Teladorsagia circumcincta]